jgi:hypothetical protein
LFLDLFRKALITPVVDFGVKKILLMAVIFQPRFVSSCDDLGGAFIGNPFRNLGTPGVINRVTPALIDIPSVYVPDPYKMDWARSPLS